jgi:Fur family peroxide stress response transcriptional regulator
VRLAEVFSGRMARTNREADARAETGTAPEADHRLGRFMARCRKAGLKATHQRTEILRELASTEEHPDAETIFRGVRQRIPSISLDTVYRTLRLFEERGIISRVGFIRDRARFDANTDRHHHFVCTRCGCVRDFYSETLDSFAPPPAVRSMGTVDDVYVELRGRCRACRRAADEERQASSAT